MRLPKYKTPYPLSNRRGCIEQIYNKWISKWMLTSPELDFKILFRCKGRTKNIFQHTLLRV